MQIGNYLQYSDTDALGNNLAYNTPCKFNAKFKGSNCFYSNTTANYITLGNKADFSDVVTVEFSVIFYNKTNLCTLLSNVINDVLQLYRGANSNSFYVVLPNTLVYVFICPFNIDDGSKVDIKLSYINNTPYLWINGTSISGTTSSAAGTFDAVAYIGTRKKNGSIGGSLYNTSIWNFRCYNANGDLIHHYPMSEGMGKIIYDTVGGKHGVIVNAGNIYSVVWSKTQDYYHYNLTNGYVSIDGDDCNRFTNTLKVPLKDPTNVLIAKDSFNSDVLNYSFTGNNGTFTQNSATLQTDSTGYKYCKFNVNGTLAHTNFYYRILTEFSGSAPSSSISSPYLSPSYNSWMNINPYIPISYKIKFKIRFNSFVLNDVSKDQWKFQIWFFQGSSKRITYNITQLIDSNWYEYEYTTTTNWKSYEYNVGRDFCFFMFNSGLASGNTLVADFDIKDIEVYRCSNNTYHPPIENGHNGAETLMDFTQQGSTNIAEIQKPILANYRPGLIQSSDRSMGANGSMKSNGWEGSMAAASQTARTTINNGVWAVQYNPVSVGNTSCGYIDNYDLSLEELSMMGLSTNGVKANAVQFTSGTSSISSSSAQYCGLYYRLQYSTLLGYNSSNVSINKSIYNQQYNIRFNGWLKRLTEYHVSNCYLGLSYVFISTMAGTAFNDVINSDNNWHYVDIIFPLNACIHSTGTNNKTFGITCSPTDYASYINPDTGEAYTAAEANHRPCLALANIKIVIEPADVYNNNGKDFKLYNLGINQWSEPQYKRIENQTNFEL